ncbi:MAG: MFS transporter, partial [Acidobacteria bacterium]|nr:MFS transporter [Acidobacteriota bacterium]
IGSRKWLAVSGYGLSALSKPFFYIAGSWGAVAAVRWADRIGKGIRTAPRDALVADSVRKGRRGLAFGIHRAADSAGAVVGLLIALYLVSSIQPHEVELRAATFRTLVLWSLIPAFLAVLALAVGARDVPRPAASKEAGSQDSEAQTSDSQDLTPGSPANQAEGSGRAGGRARDHLGRPFWIFLGIVAIFELGNSSDGFLVLRAQERGLGVTGVLAMLVAFNLVYSLVSAPAGHLSDRFDRRRFIVAGWLVYAALYASFALAQSTAQVVVTFILYGAYYGLSYGTARALVAELVPAEIRGTAYGLFNATVGILSLPASLLAGLLWQGLGSWHGFGPAAPFWLGAGTALVAAVGLMVWRPAGPEPR